jgi:hypothetical protein
MMIMKIERWIASTLLKDALKVRDTHFDRLYTMDVSRKNPRFWSTLDIQHEGDMKEGY